jgi:hypothetical protein
VAQNQWKFDQRDRTADADMRGTRRPFAIGRAKSRVMSRVVSLGITIAFPLCVALASAAFNESTNERAAHTTAHTTATQAQTSAPSAGQTTPAPARPAAASTSGASATGTAVASTNTTHGHQWIEMRNVDLGVSDSVTIRVRTLHGEVFRTSPDHPATLDDPLSFKIHVTGATVGLTGADLGAILNTVVFAYKGAPLRDLQVRTDGDQIIQTGIMHKGVDLKFRLRGQLTLMPDGRIRIHPTAMRILGINGEKVLSIVGLHLDNILDLKGAKGATVKGDDLFLDPLVILPPPAIDGKLAAIRIEGTEVVQDFVRLPEDSVFGHYVRSDTTDHNFIYFRGGELRFGKLLMYDTDLRIVDADPKTPFDMKLPHYSEQLVAGRSRTLANQGLVVTMPDYSTLKKADSTRAVTASGK